MVHPGSFSGSGLEKDRREKEAGDPAGKSSQLLRFFWASAPTDGHWGVQGTVHRAQGGRRREAVFRAGLGVWTQRQVSVCV